MIAAVAALALTLAPKPVVAILPTVANTLDFPGATVKEIDLLQDDPWIWTRSGADKIYATPEVLAIANAMKKAGLPSEGGHTVQPEGFGYNLTKAVVAARAVGADFLAVSWIFKVRRQGSGPYRSITISGALTFVDLRGPKPSNLAFLQPVSIFRNDKPNEAQPDDMGQAIKAWASSLEDHITIEVIKSKKKTG